MIFVITIFYVHLIIIFPILTFFSLLFFTISLKKQSPWKIERHNLKGANDQTLKNEKLNENHKFREVSLFMELRRPNIKFSREELKEEQV